MLIPILVPKTPKGKNTFFIFLVSLFCFFFCILLIAGITELTASGEVVDISTATSVDLKSGQEYYFENSMLVVDEYGTEVNTKTNEKTKQYLLVLFKGADGKLRSASLGVEPSTAIHGQISRYLADDSAGIGALMLSGCFNSGSTATLDSKIQLAYASALNDLQGIVDSTSCNLHFEYDASNPEGYRAMKKSTGTALTVIGGVFLPVFIFILVLLIRHRKKIKQREAAMAPRPGNPYMYNGYNAPGAAPAPGGMNYGAPGAAPAPGGMSYGAPGANPAPGGTNPAPGANNWGYGNYGMQGVGGTGSDPGNPGPGGR